MKKLSHAGILGVFLITSFSFAQGTVLNQTLTHDGIERSYNVFVPSTYSSEVATPLVLNMHGLSGNAEQQMDFSAMNPVAEAEGFLVAYPDAVDGDWAISNDHNISFIDSLLDAVGGEYNVDSTRTYATGFSQGGIMSYVLGVARSDVFAAIAPVGGTRGLVGQANRFPSFVEDTPSRPVPLMHIHGTVDAVIPYEGGEGFFVGAQFPKVETVLSEWVSSNGCDLEPTVVELPNVSTIDDSTVTSFVYGGCDTYESINGGDVVADVIHLRVNEGNHSWPVPESSREAALASITNNFGEQSLPLFVPINSDFDASAEIWGFFERHTAVVPEPHGVSLMWIATVGLALSRRRR